MECSIKSQKIWLCSLGVLFFILALLTSLLWELFALNVIIYPRLKINEGTQNYKSWIKTPDSIEVNLEIFMFNWTNIDQIHNPLVKPHFQEVGPYVFSEKHIKTDVAFHSNGTVTYNQIRVWHFNKEKSNGTLDDEITNLNVIAASVAYDARNFSLFFKKIIKTLMILVSIKTTKSVRELLFDGYEDPLLNLIFLNPFLPNPPFKTFGWYIGRNNSWKADGSFTMSTGKNDIFDLGKLQTWKYNDKVGMFRGQCDKVEGLTGDIWPPIQKGKKPDLNIFASDMCRAITIKYDSEVTKYGIDGYKWVADEKVFDNGERHPDMACYCTSDKESCPDLKSGVFNASACKFNAPVFISFPHFYLADQSYTSKIDGMRPNKNDHEFFVSIEPITGIPLEIRAQAQINILIKNYPETPFTDVPEMMVPMFWTRQTAKLKDELISQAELAGTVLGLGTYLACAMVGISFILFGVFAYLYMTKWRRNGYVKIDEAY